MITPTWMPPRRICNGFWRACGRLRGRRDKLEAAEPITIEDNVWLGGGAIVLPGVRIGANSVIGAGAVVTKDVPANVVAVGNPARVIRSI